MKLSLKLLSGFPLAFIGWDLAYASALFPVPNMNFNLFAHSVAGPCGDRFLRKAKRNNRAVFVWTVNDVSWMEWSISKDLDGVITDDPKLFLQVCDRWKKKPNSSSIPAESDGKRRFEWTMKQLGGIMIFYILLVIGLIVFRVRHGTPKAQVRKALGYLKY